MKALTILFCTVQLCSALVFTNISGELRKQHATTSEKEFYHPDDTIHSGVRLYTGPTGMGLAQAEKKAIVLLPASEYSIYYSDTLLQITLHKGSIYILDRNGHSKINCGETTVTAFGTTSIEKMGDTIKVVSVKGGATIFNEQKDCGELLKKGYILTLTGAESTRNFYKESDLVPLCSFLPCDLKKALFCTHCPDETELIADQNTTQVLDGTLYLHPFTLEADNSFPIPAINFSRGISTTEAFERVSAQIITSKSYALYAQLQKSGKVNYLIVDGIITPDKNNPNRAICELQFFSGKSNSVIAKKRLALFLLDDFSTGGKVIDPLFFEEAGQTIVEILEKH